MCWEPSLRSDASEQHHANEKTIAHWAEVHCPPGIEVNFWVDFISSGKGMHNNHIFLCSGRNSVVHSICILNLQPFHLVVESLLLRVTYRTSVLSSTSSSDSQIVTGIPAFLVADMTLEGMARERGATKFNRTE